MWSSLWTWAGKNKILAGAIVLACILVLSGAIDGIGARRAATRYFDLAKGWAAAYQRDTAASKKEYENKISVLTLERNAYRKKYEAAKGKMGAAWIPPKNPSEIEERFRTLGYSGRAK